MSFNVCPGIDWLVGDDGKTPGYTFNLLTGCWGPQGTRKEPNHCPYCYARTFALRHLGRYAETEFRPTVHADRFVAEPPPGQHRIFACSMADPCGGWDWANYADWAGCSPYNVQARLWRYIEAHPQHQFIMLTKNPGGLKRPDVGEDLCIGETHYGDLPSNLVWGISITGSDEESQKRLETYLRIIRPGEPKLISYEPAFTWLPELSVVEPGIGWLIIGADSSPGAEPVEHRFCEAAVDNARLRGWNVWTKGRVIKQLGPYYDRENGATWPREQLPLPVIPAVEQCPMCGGEMLAGRYLCNDCERREMNKQTQGKSGPPEPGDDGYEVGCD